MSDLRAAAATVFDHAILHNNPVVRWRMLEILDAALAAVRPDAAVHAQLRREGNLLIADRTPIDLAACRRVFVLGAGKAGAPMAKAVEAVLGDLITAGLVVVKDGHGGPTQWIEVAEAGHPVPTQAALEGGRRVLSLAAEAQADDLVIVLLSGGGSALLEAVGSVDGSAPVLTLDDFQATTGSLLACGATIGEINCLRKHLSGIKGGQLARAAYPARLLTLVLSDVVGSPLDVIASGPTVPDPTTWADAWQIVEKYRLADRLPPAVTARLRAGLAGEIVDTPKPGDPVFADSSVLIVGDNRVAALAAVQKAQTLGYNSLLLSTFVEGEAKDVALLTAALAKEVLVAGHPVPAPACLVLGGETTVTLQSGDGPSPGKGGRNQELALAAALALAGVHGVTVASLATDGSDGPTDSAGAIVDGGTVMRGTTLQANARSALRDHDAYPFLEATGDLLRSGPTQTNVNDLIVLLVESNNSTNA
jgi:hydroxypyruvate reductase